MEAPKKRIWTVTFLIKAVDNTINDLISMVDELMKIRFRSSVTVLLCVNFDRNNLKALLARDASLISKDPNVVFTTMFFWITKNENHTENILSIIGEKRDFDITEENDLSSFFKKKVLQRFKAKRYLLFTWDHGNGSEIFSGPGQGNAENAENNFIVHSEIPVLTMDELSRAIRWAMGSKKFDLAIMMNCSMQVFDTGYALRYNVEYLVAPQNSMGFMDYDYPAIFSRLAMNPAITARRLAAFVIESFTAKVRREGTRLNVSLSACHLIAYNQMARLLNNLAGSLLVRLPQEFNSIRDAFKESRSVDDGLKLIDLYALISNFEKISTARDQPLIRGLFNLRNFCIYRKYIGPDLISTSDDIYQAHNGISIRTPVKNPLPKMLILLDGFFTTSFQTMTTWGELMAMIRKMEEGK